MFGNLRDPSIENIEKIVIDLLKNGKSTEALNFLISHSDRDPNNAELSRILGMLYRRLGDSTQAVYYLERALRLTNKTSKYSSNYNHNVFSNDDLEYLDREERCTLLDEFQIAASPDSESNAVFSRDNCKDNIIVCWPNTEAVFNTDFVINNSNNSVNDDSLESREILLNQSYENSKNNQHLHYDGSGIDDRYITADIREDYLISNEEDYESILGFTFNENCLDDGDSSFNFSEIHAVEDFDDIIEIFEDHNDDDFIHDNYEIWEDLEDSREVETAVSDFYSLKDSVSRYDRARQKAVEVLTLFDWEKTQLSLITQILYENGWGAAKKAIEREIADGATAEELMLARELKLIWCVCDRYWINFQKVTQFSNVTDATYRILSWRQALRIIRIFANLPSIEEIEYFLEDEFEFWYHHRILRLRYPAFLKYLLSYRIRNNYPNLSASDPRRFEKPLGFESLTSTNFIYSNSDEMRILHEFGIDLLSKYSPKSYYFSDIPLELVINKASNNTDETEHYID